MKNARIIFSLSLLLCIVTSWMIAPQFIFVKEACCCVDEGLPSSSDCPCKSKKTCCPAGHAFARAAAAEEPTISISFYASSRRQGHLMEQQRGDTRVESPPSPPPKAIVLRTETAQNASGET